MADKYVEGIGRRKTATARVRLTPAKETKIVVNEKSLDEYFRQGALQADVRSVLEAEDAGIEHYSITAKVYGGGLSSQAEAIRLGIARALVEEKASRRSILKPLGFLKRDPRSVERKKFGLRKARKRPAWSKR
ncbi:30S ribosomal protein S9 [Candidatus Parcubacteria bacterium]|uniref:Small ribosomal subunit protein uS9 n=1 Tax=Candidatus Kaiserbacteria bacterium CG10_big_fil_rev_8_21_14_0_10_47_16 TaxID=1974608 RepID=A0A2H0UG36_9BACT|nr:30S ribosomal protein S9 [Candidatus Parcubacteria bacterium]PIR84765.1 MAG: 30S ribosomal protein S9 [Candidatus Kaiserbacteria bacterium CG10_big_fil_rev_8_21_14_0_10_47_16]